MNIKIDTKMLAELWRALDADGSGDIGRAEFVGMIENDGDNETDANDVIQKLMDESVDHSSPVTANANTSGGGGGGGISSALAHSKAEAGAITVDTAPALEKSAPVPLERAAESPGTVSATSTTRRTTAFEQVSRGIAPCVVSREFAPHSITSARGNSQRRLYVYHPLGTRPRCLAECALSVWPMPCLCECDLSVADALSVSCVLVGSRHDR